MPKVILQFNTDQYDVPEDFFRAAVASRKWRTDAGKFEAEHDSKSEQERRRKVHADPDAPIRIKFTEDMSVDQLHQLSRMIRAEAELVAAMIDQWAEDGGDQPGDFDTAVYPPPRSEEAQEAALRGMTELQEQKRRPPPKKKR
jgi:hypothetical protein